MRYALTRRNLIAAALVGGIPGGAQALPPFCRALNFANYGGPEMAIWPQALVDEVRKRIKWEDGLRVFDGPALAPVQEAARAIAASTLDMAILWSSAISRFVPAFTVLDDPRVGRAIVSSDRRLGELSASLSRAAAEAGLVLLGFAWNSDLLVLRPGSNIGSVADLRGKSIRPSSAQNQALVAELDAKSIVQPSLASIQALQAGAIDGTIVSPASLEASKFTGGAIAIFEGRLILGHGFAMLISRDTFSKADMQAQQAFRAAGSTAAQIYQSSEEASRTKIVAAQKATGATTLTLATDQVRDLADRINKRVDAQYEKLPDDIRKIVQSLGA
jgi:TRAP-type C4-dicarboxylate transport system substrate-binding protein